MRQGHSSSSGVIRMVFTMSSAGDDVGHRDCVIIGLESCRGMVEEDS
jgi:hypothetical protein